MKRKILISILIIQALLLIGCGTLYVPNTVHSPLLSKKNDFKISGQFSYSLDNKLYGVQTAFSPIANFGIIADANIRRTVNSDYDFYKGTESYEIGVGYYFSPMENVVYEIYGGYGLANLYLRGVEGEENTQKPNAKNRRIFIIQNFGYVNNFFESSFGLRILHYEHYINYKYPRRLFLNPNRLYIEPALTGKIGFNSAKVFCQILFSDYFHQEETIDGLSNIMYCIGIEINPFELLK